MMLFTRGNGSHLQTRFLRPEKQEKDLKLLHTRQKVIIIKMSTTNNGGNFAWYKSNIHVIDLYVKLYIVAIEHVVP